MVLPRPLPIANPVPGSRIMIIHSARFRNLYGHLNLALEFRSDINILIGINGTGKTSVLNAIAWILSPAAMQNGFQAAYWLSEFEFDEIRLTYSASDHHGCREACARRFRDHITIQISGIDDEFQIPILPLPELPYGEQNRYVRTTVDSIAREVARQENNPVLKHLSELQVPLYLPLNRRWMEEWASQPSHRARTQSIQILTGTPVTEILRLAERTYRREQAEIARLNDKLRSDMLATLFDVGQKSFIDTVPSVEEVTRQRKAIVNTLDSLDLKDVQSLSQTYFDRLERIAAELGSQELPDDFHSGPHADAWWRWITETASLAGRIDQLMQLTKDYQSKRERISRRTTSFLQSVNDFLYGKRMVFSPEAELKVELPVGRQVGGHHLSSGEMQILILFAFLYFQFNDADRSFVVLVDEPELSLHVAWQHPVCRQYQVKPTPTGSSLWPRIHLKLQNLLRLEDPYLTWVRRWWPSMLEIQ